MLNMAIFKTVKNCKNIVWNNVLTICRYADIVDVWDSVLIENQNKMVPAKVKHISVHVNEGIYTNDIFIWFILPLVIDQSKVKSRIYDTSEISVGYLRRTLGRMFVGTLGTPLVQLSLLIRGRE